MKNHFCLPASAQTVDDGIWKEIDLHEMDYQTSKNYCARLSGRGTEMNQLGFSIYF